MAPVVEEAEEFGVGDLVELHGLRGAAALNGRRGRVVRFVSETRRFGVRLEGDGEAKAIQAVNLRRVDETATATFRSRSDGEAKRGTCTARPRNLLAQDCVVSTSRGPLHGHESITPPGVGTSTQEAASVAVSAARSGHGFSNDGECPDLVRVSRASKVLAISFVCGMVASEISLCPTIWFVWSFLAIHVLGVIFLADVSGEEILLALSIAFGFHMGFALSQLRLWVLGLDGDSSVGPWSLVVFFASARYVHNFVIECTILPSDFITSISFCFPMFPAYNAAVVLSCLELFLEWRYFPQCKFWSCGATIGTVCMALGQLLVALATHSCGRNSWASCRELPEEEKGESYAGLEIPNRRVVQEGIYRWERHPAYLGGMLWGIGCQIALCNPVMLLAVASVLWASLLYIVLEEEQELFDEFKEAYAEYAALTPCWIPMFNTLLENAAFQRELADHCADLTGNNLTASDGHADSEDGIRSAEGAEEDEEVESRDSDIQSEDELLPTWEGVPKGGALWNRQFREPWILG